MTPEEKKQRRAAREAEEREQRALFPWAGIGKAGEFGARLHLDGGSPVMLTVYATVNPEPAYARKIDEHGHWEETWNVQLDENPVELARFIHALSMRLKAQMQAIAEKSKAAREALEEAERLGRETAA